MGRSLGLGLLTLMASAAGLDVGTAPDQWPHWRGPFFNGSSTATNLPTTFSKSENVAWTATLPGPSAATPAVWGQQVFVSSTDAEAGTLLALALDRSSGRELWRHQLGEKAGRDNMSNYASPSPTTDGTRVFFFYGEGTLAAFDFAGKQQWLRHLTADYGEFAFNWTFASSPLLYDGRLYVQVLQRDVPVGGRGRTDGPNESYLLALDPVTGQELWRQARPSDARAESRESFASPVPYAHNGRREILLIGGDCLTGHDPANGQELWRWGTWNPTRIPHWRHVPSPVATSGIILACAPKRDPIYAIKAGGHGELGDAGIAWKSSEQRELTSDVPTPLVYLGDFFVLSDLQKCLARVDPMTGRARWLVRTPGNAKYEASPTGADGRLYLVNFHGDVVVVDASDGTVRHQAAFGEPGDDRTRSTIAAAGSQLFIRTNTKLYCVGSR